jgi:hypothetical protein
VPRPVGTAEEALVNALIDADPGIDAVFLVVRRRDDAVRTALYCESDMSNLAKLVRLKVSELHEADGGLH